MDREEEIKLIAYGIWEEEGCPHGRHHDHWYRAEIIWEEKQKPQTPAPVAVKTSKEVVKNSKPVTKINKVVKTKKAGGTKIR